MGWLQMNWPANTGIGSRKIIDGLTGSPSDKQKFLKAEADRLIAVAVETIGEI